MTYAELEWFFARSHRRGAGLKEGDDIEIEIADARAFEVKSPDRRELLARLRKYRGRLPADFKFDRLDANARR